MNNGRQEQVNNEREYFTPLHHEIAQQLGLRQTPGYATWDTIEDTAPVQVVDRLVRFVLARDTKLQVMPVPSSDQLDEELRQKITKLRRERDAHQMDESDYVDSVVNLFNELLGDAQQQAYHAGVSDVREYHASMPVPSDEELRKRIGEALSRYASYTHVPSGMETTGDWTKDHAIGVIMQLIATPHSVSHERCQEDWTLEGKQQECNTIWDAWMKLDDDSFDEFMREENGRLWENGDANPKPPTSEKEQQ